MLTPEEDSDSRFVDPATIGCDNYDANFDKKKRRKRGATAEAAHPLGIITALVVTAGVLSCEALWKENLGFAQNLAWNSVQASFIAYYVPNRMAPVVQLGERIRDHS